MGHEFSGTVLETGEEVSGFAPGDRVVVNPNGDWCGRCQACRRGDYNMCPEIWPNAVGLARDGGLAPYACVRAKTLHRLPDSLDLASAAWVEPLAVALRAVRRSGIGIGAEAVIFGGGPIGLLITRILVAFGASGITVVEPHAARRDLALRSGAAAVIDPARQQLSDHFADIAPDYAFECSGSSQSVRQAVGLLAPRGILTVTGFSRVPPVFDAADLLFREILIQGSFIYVDEFAEAIDLLARQRIQTADLVSGILSVEQAPQAFAEMRTSAKAIKFMISDTKCPTTGTSSNWSQL
jgi:threonine dehydrogenase-like Zn-dependent dehydrogenase